MVIVGAILGLGGGDGKCKCVGELVGCLEEIAVWWDMEVVIVWARTISSLGLEGSVTGIEFIEFSLLIIELIILIDMLWLKS